MSFVPRLSKQSILKGPSFLPDNPARVFLVAGEASGDALGASLIEGLKSLNIPITFEGIGGPLMAERGSFYSLVPFADLGVMGLEMVKSLPLLMRHLRHTRDYLRSAPPDILLTIDAPEFSFRLACSLANLSTRKIHCVAPSVWAWRPKRAQKIAGFLDHLLTLFPFEGPYFEKEGLQTTFVGHPLGEKSAGEKSNFWKRYPNLCPENPLLIIAPGSRRREIQDILPIFLETARRLKETIPDLQFVLPTLPSLVPLIQNICSSFSSPLLMVEDRSFHSAVFASGTAALATSGTITLEIALEETPLVGAYHVSWIIGQIMKRMLQTPWVTLPNILLGKGVVPECLQKECNPSTLYANVYPLLKREKPWELQKKAFTKIRSLLNAEKPFGIAAAEVVEAYL